MKKFVTWIWRLAPAVVIFFGGVLGGMLFILPLGCAVRDVYANIMGGLIGSAVSVLTAVLIFRKQQFSDRRKLEEQHLENRKKIVSMVRPLISQVQVSLNATRIKDVHSFSRYLELLVSAADEVHAVLTRQIGLQNPLDAEGHVYLVIICMHVVLIKGQFNELLKCVTSPDYLNNDIFKNRLAEAKIAMNEFYKTLDDCSKGDEFRKMSFIKEE